MMGAQSSKIDQPLPFPITVNSQYTANLNAYEAACKNDPDLQAFDASIQERTKQVRNSLTAGIEPELGSISLDALVGVTDCLLEMNQDAVKLILNLSEGEDLYKNKELSVLVGEYFDSSLKSLDFCTSLEKCLRRLHDSQMSIKLAVKVFEEEELQNGNDVNYVKTTEQLRKFKSTGDPFTEEFVILFRSVYNQHVSMFKKLQVQKRKLDKKLKSLKTWRKVSNVIFIAAFASVLIFSVVAVAIAAPPVVTALVAALVIPVGPVGKWCNTLWTRYMKTFKVQRELINSMQGRTWVVLRDFETIRVIVSKLEIHIDSLLQNADLGLREEDALKIVIDEIKKKLEPLDETVENLSKHADKCSRDITMARTVILQKILRHSNS